MEHYDPLIDILKIAEESVHPAKAAVLRNLQIVLLDDAELSKDLSRRVAEVLKRWSFHSEDSGNLSRPMSFLSPCPAPETAAVP